MERIVLKLADQLDALDEESLGVLWSKYGSLTANFEPSKEWERAALVFCLIMAKTMTNTLFNYYMTERYKSPAGEADRPKPAARHQPCPVIPFVPLSEDGKDK